VAAGGDVFSLLALLRRMMLWPVTAELLRATAAGKQVAALKQHPDPQVRPSLSHSFNFLQALSDMPGSSTFALRHCHVFCGTVFLRHFSDRHPC
jgi:hypothetical protein